VKTNIEKTQPDSLLKILWNLIRKYIPGT